MHQQEFFLIPTDTRQKPRDTHTVNLAREGENQQSLLFSATATVPEDSQQKTVFCLQVFLCSHTILPQASQTTSVIAGRSRNLLLTLLLTVF